jgi:ATP-dependent DNA helicase RecG
VPAPPTESSRHAVRRVLASSAPLTALSGVGPKAAAKLGAAGIHTLRDLLFWFPRRGQAVDEIAALAAGTVGALVRVHAEVLGARLSWLPRRRTLVTVEMRTAAGEPFSVAFFNQPYLRRAYRAGDVRWVEGYLARRGTRSELRQGRILPVAAAPSGPLVMRYPEVEGVSEARLRGLVHQALQLVDLDLLGATCDPLPPDLATGLPSAAAALRAMHAPRTAAEHDGARARFAFAEAVAIFRRLEHARARRAASVGPKVSFTAELLARIEARVPFPWTADQAAAIAAIRGSMAGPAPMAMLLQGDVGTGKTAVAMFAALATLAAGHQVAFLAPTELLAEQHFTNVSAWLAGSRVRVALLTASVAAAQRASVLRDLAGGEPMLVLGTHALLGDAIELPRLGLAVIDEQHRFGVDQRLSLVRKARHPHVLVLTATPIPRTLALTLFGDLDVAVLRGRPPGRRPVRTVQIEAHEWPRVLRAIGRCVGRGGRAFVVCPTVQEGADGGAVRMHAELQRRFDCALVHGSQSPDERRAALAAFRAGNRPVLVGTTVLELGVDAPEATLMVVTGADRFGLATLHQLRGRVGRGGRRALCLLVGSDNPRLRAVVEHGDGFALAEEDLRLRGAGELLGTRQSGVSDLRALDLVGDFELLQRARAAVRAEAGAATTEAEP